MNVEYRQRFNQWLSLYFTLSMAGRLGTDISTILANGISTVKGGNIGEYLEDVINGECKFSFRGNSLYRI